MMELQRRAANEKMKEGGAEFFSEEDYGKFYMAILGPLKDLISEKFSMPSSFLERGLYDRLSDYRPEGILAKTAREIGINLDSKHVPLRYDIHLILDKALSQKHATLVFSLTEKSDGVEFSKRTFTIEQLERYI